MHGNDHSHPHPQAAPATQGRTISWASHYDLVVKLLSFGRENALRSRTLRQAAISSGESVLDVGCGTGTLTLLAKTQTGTAGNVHGIDASPEMIAVARQKSVQQKAEVDFQTGVIEALPFSDGTFDVVLSSLMFHHLPPDLKQRGLAEIHRVLKPGGRLLVVDMARPRTLAQRLTMFTLVHGGLSGDVSDLRPLMIALGYQGSQTGSIWGSIGFVQASRSPAQIPA
ncbi:MAG: class I SAM-dependent methyltransferase [Chloroflexi bacterium]|nr:class I SAM-dependent methyltransferase [Chloroflexota bacterium]